MKWFRRKKANVEVELTLEEQLVEAKAHLARVKKLPLDAFRPRTPGGMLMSEFSVDIKDNAIAYAEADVAELKVRLASQTHPEETIKK